MDTTTLQMALIGYEAERQKIQAKIAELRGQLGGRAATDTPPAEPPATRTRRRRSAAARKRIAAAQKARWAAFRKKQKAA